jgi:hypothetical protein
MIIWKGRGILILLFALGGFVPGVLLDSMTLAFWGAAAGAWLFALTVGKTTQQLLVDPQTQQPVVLKRAHTLYFIPPKGWAVLFTTLALFITFMPKNEQSEGSSAAQVAFKEADNLITSSVNGTVHGNTPQAIAVAKEFASSSKEFRDLFIEKGKNSEFLTYVHLTPTRCIFLLNVPQLRKFSKEAKETMAQVAWVSAQTQAAKLSPKPVKVALGLRGSILYDRAYIGHPVSGEEKSKGIDQEVKGMDAKDALTLLFEPETDTPKTVTEAGETPAPVKEAAASADPASPATSPVETAVTLPTPMRDWKDSTGRPLRASMVRFVNAERSTGEFKREDGQLFEVPLDRFSEEDKKFIQSLSDQ